MTDNGKRDRERFSSQYNVSQETLARFDRYADLLRLWNPKINLVGPTTLPDLWSRHFIDSAQLFSYLPEGRLVDLGSGAGFPGLALAILGRDDVHLVESDQRKSVFLREVARETKTAVTVHSKRIEDISPLQADVITARALAPLERLVPWAWRHLKADGQMVFLKGADLDREIAALDRHWMFSIERFASRTAPDAAIVRLTHLSPKGDLP